MYMELKDALLIGTQLASILTGISVIFVALQFIKSVKSQNLQSFFYIHQYLSNNTFGKARHTVRKELAKKAYSEWKEDDMGQVNKVCSSYDQTGILISMGVLDKKTKAKFLASSWGESICDQFEILEEFLNNYQTPNKKGKDFFVHFEELYNEAKCYHRK